MTEILDRCIRYLLDIVFPNRCPFCGKFIPWNVYICEECSSELSMANDFICRKCGKRKCVCELPRQYDMTLASLFYNEKPVRKAIIDFKNTGDENIAGFTADDIAYHMEKENIPAPYAVIPVPMGKKKQRKRGHNQAEILARCIGRRLGIPVINNILFKFDTDDEQHSHGREEREERVKTLFYAGKDISLAGKTVFLCDDVMTTGATLNECAELLKGLGAVSVIAAVCAVTETTTTAEEGN